MALLLVRLEKIMDTIQSALFAFKKLIDYTYHFIIAHQKNKYEINLTFHESDFRHCAGLQYLKDIDIPRNTKKLFDKIENHELSDDVLSESAFYEKVQESYANVKSRIFGLQHIEKYLDNKNLVCKYVKYMNKNSSISADYLIKSVINRTTAYIFIRERRQSDEFCICSFFIEPKQPYNGIKAYWLRKEKINNITQDIFILYDRLLVESQKNQEQED